MVVRRSAFRVVPIRVWGVAPAARCMLYDRPYGITADNLRCRVFVVVPIRVGGEASATHSTVHDRKRIFSNSPNVPLWTEM